MNGPPPRLHERFDDSRHFAANATARVHAFSGGPAACLGCPPAETNHVLASLSAADRHRWQQRLVPVHLCAGSVLHEAGQPITQVHFPVSAVFSLQGATSNGGSAEIAIAGRDAMAGVSLLMGECRSTHRVVVQGGGHAYRVDAHWMLGEFNGNDRVRVALLRYADALLTQMAQTVLCNRHHSLAQQLCRRLLRGLDRVDSNQLAMTHEVIAGLLGVRREGVTEAACQLSEAGLIDYRRGRITVLDRAGLERRSCECYEVDRRNFGALLPSRYDPYQAVSQLRR